MDAPRTENSDIFAWYAIDSSSMESRIKQWHSDPAALYAESACMFICVTHISSGFVVRAIRNAAVTQKSVRRIRTIGYYDSSLMVTCEDKIQRASDKAAATVGRAMFGYAVGKSLEAGGLSLLAALI
jgi:hypothetical protein